MSKMRKKKVKLTKEYLEKKTPVKKRQQKYQTKEQLKNRWELLIILINKQIFLFYLMKKL